MKSNYKAGDTLTLRLRKDDSQLMEWAAKQSGLGDSIRFLIEQEIQRNGYKDLSLEIMNRRVILPTSTEITPKLLAYMVEKESSTLSDAYEAMAKEFDLSEEAQNIKVRNGDRSQWQLNVRWARKVLERKELLKQDSPRGLWEISEKGKEYYSKKK